MNIDGTTITTTAAAVTIIVSLFGWYYQWRKQETQSIDTAVAQAVEIEKLRARVEKLEQRVDLKDEEQSRELREIKDMISEVFERVNAHIEYHVGVKR